MTTSRLQQALAHAEAHFDRAVQDLTHLVAIPGVSMDPEAGEALDLSAEAVAVLLRASGFQGVEVLRLAGAPPYVYGEWAGAEGAPTLLLYAHHDVQPPGREERWESPPFRATLREDGRLYGRGVVDDKAGVLVHAVALAAWRAAGGPPINLKLVVEGEEEAGSDHLGEFLAVHRDRLSADVIVLTDTANLDTGIPSLTYRLRGIVTAVVEYRSMKGRLHSGMWGGPVPDPVMALCKVLGSLTRDDGTIAIEGVYDGIREPSEGERALLAALPYDEAAFREQAGLLPGTRLVGETGRTVYERLWTRPSITVSALEASPLKGSSNQIVEAARAKVGIRLVPGQEPARIAALLKGALVERAPWGVEAVVDCEGGSPGWMTDPTGPAFEAARRALEAGFGVPAASIGCGGSIPFVEPFAEVLGGAPALLLGLEDPTCAAHAENESLHLGDFRKAIRAAVHLYAELAGYRKAG